MLHPMFKIEEEVKKYPKVADALESAFPEMEGNLFWTVGEMGLLSLPKRIIKAADEGLDGTAEEKQAIIIGALYSLAPRTLAEDMDANAYGPEANAVLAELAAQKKDAPASEKISRVMAVTNVGLNAAMLPMLAASGPNPQAAAAVRAGLADAERIFVPNLNAPRLEADYRASMDAALQVMEGKAPKGGLSRRRHPHP